MARRQTETSYLGPFAEFDRVWPVAGLTLALIATVSSIGLLGYVAIKLFSERLAVSGRPPRRNLDSPRGVPRKIVPRESCSPLITYSFRPTRPPIWVALRFSPGWFTMGDLNPNSNHGNADLGARPHRHGGLAFVHGSRLRRPLRGRTASGGCGWCRSWPTRHALS
jgi:hypothetical protein